jgi:periplasmic copper chaperone A
VKPVLLSALLLASCSRSEGSPELQISDPWARETVAGQSATAAYMTIANNGSAADRLVGVEAPTPAKAIVHGTSHANGIVRMRPLESGVDIPVGRTTQLAPGGTHVMITGLTSPLEEGGRLKLTLRFERSGRRAVDVRVRSAL